MATPESSTSTRSATLYRMVTPTHTCPYGVDAKELLERAGFDVEDNHLQSREETDAFKAQHGVETTPQIFIDGERIGGCDDLRRMFKERMDDPMA
jgi:glutaredoxin